MEVKKKKLKKGIQKSSSRGTQQKLTKEKIFKLLDSVKGTGIGIWREDAQEYVNKVRDNDRF